MSFDLSLYKIVTKPNLYFSIGRLIGEGNMSNSDYKIGQKISERCDTCKKDSVFVIDYIYTYKHLIDERYVVDIYGIFAHCEICLVPAYYEDAIDNLVRQYPVPYRKLKYRYSIPENIKRSYDEATKCEMFLETSGEQKTLTYAELRCLLKIAMTTIRVNNR